MPPKRRKSRKSRRSRKSRKGKSVRNRKFTSQQLSMNYTGESGIPANWQAIPQYSDIMNGVNMEKQQREILANQKRMEQEAELYALAPRMYSPAPSVEGTKNAEILRSRLNENLQEVRESIGKEHGRVKGLRGKGVILNVKDAIADRIRRMKIIQ